MTGRLVIMGSGETAPTMVEVHRAVLAAAGRGPALLLDTPYGFQENADDLTDRAVAYFGRNVGHTVTPLPWRTRLEGVTADRSLASVRGARWVFAGPGSPTYAMRVWEGSGFAEAVGDLVRAGGTATFASAAAVTVGAVTVPVYEVYKCGADPYWAPATGLLRELTGLNAAVIPHYDNTEGGTHSTRFCYLGERRLRRLEELLPDGAHVIGVDEHTALLLDLGSGTGRVLGRGGVTVRRDGRSRVLGPGPAFAFAELTDADGAGRVGGSRRGTDGSRRTDGSRGSAGTGEPPGSIRTATGPTEVSTGDRVGPATSLRAAADTAQRRFTAALADRDSEQAGACVLELEQALADWSHDSLQSDDADHARRVLRGMVLDLAGAARTGLTDPGERLAPLVEELLGYREAARERRDWAGADRLRERLSAAGVELRDTPDGTRWTVDDR